MLREVIGGSCVVVPVVEGMDDGCVYGGVGFHDGEFVFQFLYGCLPSLLGLRVWTGKDVVRIFNLVAEWAFIVVLMLPLE